MTKDLSFLTITDDDTPEMREMKSYWQVVMSMTEPERRLFLQEEQVKEEERQLQRMIDSNKQDDFLIEDVKRAATRLVYRYEATDDEKALFAAEQCIELVRNTKKNKYTIGEIRKQRERVQWERNKLKTMVQNSDEPKPSSETSAS